MGFVAVFGHFSRFGLFLLPSRIHARPHAGTANRWASGSGVQRTFYGQAAALQDVGVDHGGFDVFVAEEFLDGADVPSTTLRVNSTVLEEVGGETMAKGVGGDRFVYPGGPGGLLDGFLEDAFVYVVAHGFAGGGVHREGDGGEEVLPGEFLGSVGVFPDQGVGEVDLAVAFLEVLLMDDGDGFDLFLESRDEGIWQDGDAVVFALAVADDDGMVAEVDIFDAQADAFHQAQAAAVEEFCHQLRQAGHPIENGEGFLVGEDGGEGLGFFGADEVGGEVDVFLEDVTVEEEDGAEGLVLGGGSQVTLGGKVRDEGLDFLAAHVVGVAFVVEEDVAADPVYVGLFGAGGVVFDADGVADLFEEFFGLGVLHIDLWEE